MSLPAARRPRRSAFQELHPSVCLPDWTTHCLLRYSEQGLWGAASALVDCSPWLLCIFFLAFYHTCWSASTLMVQLYQVMLCCLCVEPAEMSPHGLLWFSLRSPSWA